MSTAFLTKCPDLSRRPWFESRKSSDFQKMDEREFGRKIDGVKVPTRSASPLFSRFDSLGLLLVPQYKEIAGGKEILFKRGDCGNECLFGRVGLILLLGYPTRAALNEVYKPKRRLR